MPTLDQILAGLNTQIRAAGVVWHACAYCGRDWPFPAGGPRNQELDREWLCASCTSMAAARVMRAQTKDGA